MSQDQHALVLSGGGADGAYELGVLKALVSGKSPSVACQPIEPQVFTGTSIGAFNAAFLVSQWQQYGVASVANLETVWLNRLAQTACGNEAYRIRLNPFELLDPRCYLPDITRPFRHFLEDSLTLGWSGIERMVNLWRSDKPILERVLELPNFSDFVSVDPWAKLLEEEIDYENIRQSDKTLRVIATNWGKGAVKIFSNSDLTDKLGPQAIRGSSAIPGFFPPAAVGNQVLVDGGVLLNTPLKPAIRAGASTLHVINMNTAVKNIPLDALPSTLETFYRQQLIGWAATLEADIKRAESYNQCIELFRRSQVGEELESKELKTLMNAAGPVAKRLKDGATYKPVTIHRYHPLDELGGILGLLNLGKERIIRLIELGFNDAVNHDCELSGCVRLEEPEEELKRESRLVER